MIMHQHVIIRSSVNCSVWDCHHSFAVEVENIGDGTYVSGQARDESTQKMLNEARLLGWTVGGRDTVCPSHSSGAVADYVNRKNKQLRDIADQGYGGVIENVAGYVPASGVTV